MPYVMMFNSVGFMFGTGGSALIAKRLGEKRHTHAQEIFTTLVFSSLIVGVCLAILGELFLKNAAYMQGARGTLLENSMLYARLYFIGTPACLIQFEFEALYQTSGKGPLGLKAAMISGLTNIVLDALFLGVFSLGIVGASIATVISQYIGGCLPLLYYSRENNSTLRFVKGPFHGRELLKMCGNGSSEMVNNISMSVVCFFYNIQLIGYGGANGIAAFGIMNYVSFLFTAIFWGYISGISPVISFHYGACNHQELKSLFKKSVIMIASCCCVMFVLSELLAGPIIAIYAGNENELMKIGIHGFRLFAFNFLFAGFSIFFSAFFTALNNGLISAILSFCRVFVFQIPAVFLLPRLWQLDGIWISVSVAELMTVLLSLFFLVYTYKNNSEYVMSFYFLE